MRRIQLSLVIFVVGLWAWGCPTTQVTTPDAGIDAAGIQDQQGQEKKADKVVDNAPKVDLFDPQKILKIEITMAPADWDDVRTKERTYRNLLEPNCRAKPFESPFVYRKAEIVVDGVKLSNVGVRKKGFVGSIDSNKPSLKVKFDAFVEGQELHGLERLTLNNNRSDRSMIRQCLAYRFFAKAGIPAARCNFAHVYMNGKSLGLFSHIESVKKRYLKRHFEDNDGRLYEGTLSDFREGWMGTFEPKTLKEDPSRADIQAVKAALEQPDEKLLEALKPLIDVDKFIRFWAVETIVNHLDGYAGNTNNFYIYNDPTSKKLVFMPWGMDMTFSPRQWQPKGAPPHILAKGKLARRLYRIPSGRAKYFAALKSLLDNEWNEADLAKQIDVMEGRIATIAIADPAHKGKNESFKKEIDSVRTFIKDRRKQLQALIDAPPEWDAPLPGKLCFQPNGEMSGSFKTSFGTLSQQGDPFVHGSASVTGTLDGKEIKHIKIGSKAGADPKRPHIAIVQLILQVSQTDFLVANMVFPKSDARVAEAFPLRGPLKGGGTYLISYNAQTRQSKPLALLWEGELTLTEASEQPGGAVVGGFKIKWVSVP